jgi:hypothetical protein
MSENSIGIPVETESNSENIFVLKVQKNNNSAVVANNNGKFLTAQGEAVVLTDTLEPGSRWVIRNPLKTDLSPNDGWFSLESATDPGRFLRHYSLFVYAHLLKHCQSKSLCFARWGQVGMLAASDDSKRTS